MYLESLTLGLTNHCNMACTYCFEGLKQRFSMPYELAAQSIDWLLSDEISGPQQQLSVTFFGGEPLLEIGTIRRLVPYARSKAEAAGKQLHFNMTTNGTLFGPETAEYWRDQGMGVLLSCDGLPEAHDLNRKMVSGKGSFRVVERNMRWILEAGGRQVRMTVVPETSAMMRGGAEFLSDRGFTALAIFPVEERRWSREQLTEHEAACYELADFYVECLEADREIAIEPLDRHIRALLDPGISTGEQAPCGAGRTYAAISADGTLYPCHRFLSADGFRGAYPIGHVGEGFDQARRLPFLRMERRRLLGCDLDCASCSVRESCSGGCMAANLESTGHIALRPRHSRYHELIWSNTARAVIDYMNEAPCTAFEKRFSTPTGEPSREAREAASPDATAVC